MGGIHAIEHAAIGMFPLFALCDRNDIGGISQVFHPQIQKSAIFIYDGYPGGVGLAQRGFEIVLQLLEKTCEVIKACECEEGCPSCIHSPKCGNGNKPLDKQAALLILEGLLGRIPLSAMSPPAALEDEAPPPSPSPPSQGPPPGPRILFLDLETQRSAEDVGGWRNAQLMRVSVAVVLDSLSGEYHAYLEGELDALFENLESADLIVGFNVKRFDYTVLSAYTTRELKALPTFDILEDLHQRLGFRVSLDHVARETLGKKKAADGLQAIAWFREGQMGKVIAYCREDVALTRELFQYGLDKGEILFRQKQGDRRLALRVDWNLENMIKGERPKDKGSRKG
jgi:DEAD/DEAH box helicase domain-containing protein